LFFGSNKDRTDDKVGCRRESIKRTHALKARPTRCANAVNAALIDFDEAMKDPMIR
jgi:hypothetical protein